MNNLGLYLHIPFCNSKCPYCDFYSFCGNESQKENYTNALLREIDKFSDKIVCKADTLYIGGGTPSTLPAKNLLSLVNKAKERFLESDAEITIECNPFSLPADFFENLKSVSVNRISLGMQSSDNTERKLLGRRATNDEVKSAVINAKKAGISNISLDVMLGVPRQTMESLKQTLDFCISLDIPHISCYILKLEENTPFFKIQETLDLPNEDTVCDMYLFMCDYLNSHGIFQYEISNFAKKGYESRHNLKYWNLEPYLGLGPSAHSFIDGKRFYFERDIDKFISGCEPVFDCIGGDFEEFVMLSLRLKEGLTEKKTFDRFLYKIPKEIYEKANIYEKNGYLTSDANGIYLTEKGFLISNSIISDLI
ncbi:MAG: radical SAM family heme chaperone HemW [Oscillospiraceae bacterium]